uniref:Uncharacterized protein n=1 Tax=Bactrocera latifrons TaxID=174628 RepID=A0A0K8VD03_BACLA
MLFQYLIFLLFVLMQNYCSNGLIEPIVEHARRTDGAQRRYRRAAVPQLIVRSQADDFTNADEIIIFGHTLQGRIISSQQLYGLPHNQNYQQHSQANSLQKPRGNQQAHNSRELNMNGHYNSNNNLYDNNNSFNGNNMKHEKNKILQEHSGQIGIMLNNNRNNGNFKHHNSYLEIVYNNGDTHKPSNTVSMYRPAVRVDAMHIPTTTSITPAYVTQPQNHVLNPQNCKPNNNLLTEIIANPVPTTIKAQSSSEYNRSQFRRDIPNNPFLNKHMSQNEFMQNPFLANLNNQSTQNTMAPTPTPQNPYMSNPFLQNTKMPNLSGQSQSTQHPATHLMQPQIETSSQNSVNLMHVQKPVLISSTPPSTVTKISAELSRLIQNKAVIFPDSIYLTQSTPSSQHMLDIRR